MRYFRFFVFLVSLVALLFAVEGVLRLLGAPFSLRDTRGVGQVMTITLSFLWIIAFIEFVVKLSPVKFLVYYVQHWRRALAGMRFMLLTTLTVATGLFAIFLMLGWADWSSEHWAALNFVIIAITIKSLFEALVLATTEELIFRAAFLRYLRDSLRPGPTIAAILVSSAVFSLSHLIALREPDTAFLPLLAGLFLFGVMLSTTYVVTGSIACSIGLHFGLLGFKVILRETDIGSFGGDVRTGVDFFVMMVLLTVIVVLGRKRLWARFSVEPAALLDEDIKQQRISSFEPGRAPPVWG